MGSPLLAEIFMSNISRKEYSITTQIKTILTFGEDVWMTF